jgi:hypothetical protein
MVTALDHCQLYTVELSPLRLKNLYLVMGNQKLEQHKNKRPHDKKHTSHSKEKKQFRCHIQEGMYVYSRGGPQTALAPRPSLIYCA